jgi:hypothetical protein
MNRSVQYILYFTLFIIAEAMSMWGQFSTLKYPKMGMVESFLRVIPFAWADWFFMSFAVMIGDKYKLVTPTQDTFILIILQFTLLLLINHFYLKQKVTRSDMVCFGLIIMAFYISFTHAVSRLLGRPIPKKKKKKKSKAAVAGKKKNYI